MADLEGIASTKAVERVRAAVVEHFYRDSSGSLTSALVRAIQTVNRQLYDENQRSIRADHHHATICCLVLRDDDAYFALAGHGLAYLIGTDCGERFGRGDSRLAGRSADLVGESDEIEVELHHRLLDQPRAIILTSSGFVDLVGEHSDDALRGRPDRVVDGLRVIGREHRGPRWFRTMAIAPATFGTPDHAAIGDAPVGRSAPRTIVPERAPRRLRRPRRVATTDESPPIERAVEGGRPRRGDPKIHEPDELAIWSRQVAGLAPVPIDRSGERTVGPAEYHTALEPTPIDDDVDEYFELPRARWHFPKVFALPSNPAQLTLALLAILALFFVGYLGMLIAARILQGGAPYTAAMANLSQAQQRESQAMGQTDPMVRRHLLDDASRLASQALKARPDDPLAITTSARIEREYEAASGIATLPRPSPVVTLPTAGDRLIVNGTDLYVLDRANSRLYRYLLSADGTTVRSSDNPILVQQGDHIGSATVDKLSAITWAPGSSGQSAGSLLALDSSGFLVQYEPVRGLTALTLRDPGAWANVTAIGSFAGSLYALNPSQQTLASYPAQSTGFDGPVYNYLAPEVTVNLGDAVDLAVDGDLYVLHANGRIQRFNGGKPVDFAGPPSDLLPSQPAGLAVSGTAVFVGDPEHARIVQLSRTGTYQHELTMAATPSILSHMRDVAVSDDGTALYVLSGDTVYRSPLPEQGQ